MECMDYLIWIGQSYSKVLCGLKKSTCAIPFRKRPPHCYIHEAEWRGCCRKVPGIPLLAITGRTRIFLAHKDGLKQSEQGRIFGYYVLDGIETIKGISTPLDMPLQNRRTAKGSKGEITKAQCWDDSIIESSRMIDKRCPPLESCPKCKEGKTKTVKCPDGSYITTHKCVDGRWVRTQEKCADNDDEGEDDEKECEDGKRKFLICDDGVVVSHICINGIWKATGAKCPEPIPPEQTMFETERSCSLRLKPGSVYLVDALASDISKQLKKNIEKENLIASYIKAKKVAEMESLLERGRKIFIDTVDEVKKQRKTKTKIPDVLKNKVELRGEFVYFKNKVVFEKYPSASFRGILRIDGDRIIKQVSEGKTFIEIDYCDEEWQSTLSQTMRSSKTYVDRFLKALIKIAKQELRTNGEFIIPGFGRFYVIETKERPGRNPATGETITIPKKKRVKFKPYKNLRDHIDP
jgi:DNA-binding protein HU-beta